MINNFRRPPPGEVTKDLPLSLNLPGRLSGILHKTQIIRTTLEKASWTIIAQIRFSFLTLLRE